MASVRRARRCLRLLVPIGLLVWLLAGGGAAVRAQAGCEFVLGFAALKQMIPDTVGDCVEAERHNPDTGDALQRTTKGLLVWRKADNFTAFTDGYRTWINGPHGLATRLNTQRFAWEANSEGLPVVAEGPAPGALLPGHRIVAYYGNPGAPRMGVLGQGPPDQMLARLEQQAQAYAALDPATPVQPALQLVAVIAQAAPGPDGLYRGRSSYAEIEQVAQWAESRGYPLILDIQPGRSSFAAEVEWLLPFLERPYVHLALDPEWAMAGSQVPGRTFGTVDAATVNQTIQTLAAVVNERHLPPKVLIVHRFLYSMLTSYEQIQLDPAVQVVIDMDGVGGQALKIARYGQVVADQPVQFAGIKIFYTQDARPLAPAQVLALTPPPNVVIYQ